uniref:Endonuclease MutS2 n=1 Tax=candidate division WOR-3 bacterium TaxID=2052148 RepID=A0A7C4UBX7_UNCW3
MRTTYESLEYNKLLVNISSFFSSQAGSERASELFSFDNLEKAKSEFEKLKIFLKIENEFPDISRLYPVDRFINEDFFSVEKISLILRNISISKDVKEFLSNKKIFEEENRNIFPLEELENKIKKVIDDEGNVKEDASSELKRLISEKRKTEDKIKNSLINFVNLNREFLQEEVITERKGRKVVPVKKENVRNTRGIVVDISRTGETAFVEPEEVVYYDNLLTEIEIEISNEITRILKELTDEIKKFKFEIISSLKTLIFFDSLRAKSRFIKRFECIIPEFTDEEYIKLIGIRHPIMIFNKDVVPQDIEIGKDYKTLVVSGPNAGGKTVLLKTIGLSILCVLNGIPVPANEGTIIGRIERIFAVIEDEQSIDENLSTFSSHILRIKNILKDAKENDIVLIDEIGGGTDPVEGTALGYSILEELTKRGCITIATTHFPNLKYLVYNNKKMINGAMGYDKKPTYKLIIGIPGFSRALEIAEELNLPKEIIENAKKYIKTDEVEISSFINRLQEKMRLIEKEKEEIEKIKSYIEENKRLIEERVKNLKNEEEEMRKRAREEALNIIKGARSLVEMTIKEIKEKNADKESVKKYKRSFDEILSELNRNEEKKEIKIGDNSKVKISIDDEVLEKPAKIEIDVRGLLKDDAIDRVDKFIDEAFYKNLSRIRIIHGKGSGILRQAIREFLSRDKRVKGYFSEKPELGGDGVTIVDL